MYVPLVVLIPTLGAVLPALAGRQGRAGCAAVAATASLAALTVLLSVAPAVMRGEPVGFHVPWIPQIGLALSFFVDGLGLFFAALILIMGVLVIVYGRYYLAPSDPPGRFFASLLLFQGAMLGIVLSDNIILMLVFWELTSLSSFLLIGYWNHLAESRQGARMALAITGGGGLALFAGVLLLGGIAGTYELSEIIGRADAVQSSPLFGPALALILLGAFTKSAQFPFHFWLPHAMAAPTPVSAYLHSATMVKAGIFLLARLWPVFGETEAWFLTVAPIGLATMLVGAWIAIFKDDLKAVLAYSTVSHLGLITMLLGFGTKMAAVAAVLHILNHALFKAALFMSAGIVDHETGTRSMARLGGLRRAMPVTAALAVTAAAAMAGVPLLNGFVSKEMMLESASHAVYAGQAWLVPLLATLGALFSVAYSARLAGMVFFGEERHPVDAHPHDPPAGMWLPVAVLVVPAIVLGLWPALAQPLVEVVAAAVVGGDLPEFQLALWHGLTPALGMSVAALLGGVAILVVYSPIDRIRIALPRPEAKAIFDASVRGGAAASQALVRTLQNEDLTRYALVIMLATVALGVFGFLTGPHGAGTRAMLEPSLPAVVGWGVLAVACGIAVVRHRDRLLLLLVTAVAGLVVSLTFLHFSAPDLALTQISVEVVTTILLLLALNLLPKTTPRETGAPLRMAHAGLAGASGLGAGLLAFAVLTRDYVPISDYHLAQARPGGGGTNVVNVILVDFRGYDTFGEIIVLGIAALVIFALLELSAKARRAAGWAARAPSYRTGSAHPIMLVVTTRLLLPLVLTAGVYIFLRGHNLPGGGFIAGIVVGIAFIMQYVASGYAWADERFHFDPQRMIAAGVLLAGLTGVGSWAFGHPFLTSTHGHVHIPLIGDVELASVLLFDLGVFLVVVGTVLLALATIAAVESIGDRRPADDRPAAGERRPIPARPVRIEEEERV
ncbi:MAG: monovalent cation/H+ antiporter subunit A [Thalassobaculum sp.]|uniref:monovalent cation/H+ antiporter subunit A n=1 Tax=Thalassobaculum sp. TaxID=2022740 RepID=UPI0032EB544C